MRVPGFFGAARIPQRRRPGPLSSSAWPLLLFLLAAAGPVRAWESADLELFDLVEEVQLNFYEFLGVQQVSARAAAAASPSPAPHPRADFGTSGLSAGLDGATSSGMLIPFLWPSGDHPFPTPKSCARRRRKERCG